MATFSALLTFCEGNPPVSGRCPWQRPMTRSFDVFFDSRLTNWVNIRDASDLTRRHAHYGVTVITDRIVPCSCNSKRCQHDQCYPRYPFLVYMMTSSNGNIFRVRGLLCGEFTGPRWQSQWRRALMFPLICVWINGWVNNREAGDLRRYRGHYDVIVMVREGGQVPKKGTIWLYRCKNKFALDLM